MRLCRVGFLDQWNFTAGRDIKHNVTKIERKAPTKRLSAHRFITFCLVDARCRSEKAVKTAKIKNKSQYVHRGVLWFPVTSVNQTVPFSSECSTRHLPVKHHSDSIQGEKGSIELTCPSHSPHRELCGFQTQSTCSVPISPPRIKR